MKAVTKVRGKKAKIDASELSLEEKLLGIDRVTKWSKVVDTFGSELQW